MDHSDKLAELKRIIQEYNRVAVAFSGGVDSSLLAKCALDSLGAGNVLMLNAGSCLQKMQDRDSVDTWLKRHGYGEAVNLLSLAVNPLDWKEFVQNPEERCYLCKLRMYKMFIEEAEKHDIHCLLDGTNTDDLKDNRPGLRAIHQLGVKTPFLAVGMCKDEIRQVSKDLGIDTWNAPSSSCLATRLPTNNTITKEKLQLVARLEEILENLGYTGVRVRLEMEKGKAVIILQASELSSLGIDSHRVAVVRSFQNLGISKVYFDLTGR